MGIYNRARNLALGIACASGLVVGVGMAAVPGSALAVNCAKITGSGSSLQEEQQKQWEMEVGLVTFTLLVKAVACTPAKPEIKYAPTSSGQALEEFGIQENKVSKTFVLSPTLSGNGATLDAFIGTDDPPTVAKALEETELLVAKHAESEALTFPVVAAPIAVIAHLPTGCEITKAATITNANLNTVFAGSKITWLEILELANAAPKETTTQCQVEPMVDVRSDESGTSYAFKQYLCQIEPGTWGTATPLNCEQGTNFVTDAATWPQLVNAVLKAPNKGSKGEVEVVEADGGTTGSIGYVNLKNAAAGSKFTASAAGKAQFWFKIEGSTGPEEPATGTQGAGAKGNCPTEYNNPIPAVGPPTPDWSKVHLAEVGNAAYSICTLTYDIAWAKYNTKELEKEYGVGFAEVAATAEGYAEYMTSATEGQTHIAEDYSPLPKLGTSNIQKRAEEIAKRVG
jgi:ABC-type phosphate transport system substrate-binding protein